MPSTARPAGDTSGSVEVFEQGWREMLQSAPDAEFGPQERLFAEVKNEALTHILPPPPASMLECGCGTAEVSAHFALRGYDCTLLDASEAALELGRRRFERIGRPAQLVKGDVYAMPFDDGTFDVVTSFGLIEHFDDVHLVIAEMARVVKPGGMLFADIVPKRFSVDTFARGFNAAATLADGVVRGRAAEAAAEAKSQLWPDFYENDFSFEEYRGFFRDAGLVDVRGTGDRPFPALILPPAIKARYVGAMRRALPLWRRFDASSAAWTRWWGAGWWMWGTKPHTS